MFNERQTTNARQQTPDDGRMDGERQAAATGRWTLDTHRHSSVLSLTSYPLYLINKINMAMAVRLVAAADCVSLSNCLKMTQYSRCNHYSHKALLNMYYLGRLLGVVNWQLNKRLVTVSPVKLRSRALTLLWRVIVTTTVWSIMPNMFWELISTDDSSLHIFTSLQAASISIFASFTFIMQLRGESQTIAVFKRFIKIYQHIVAKTQNANMLGGNFLFLLLLKFASTTVGCLHEILAMLEFPSLLEMASTIFGIYIWLGSMLVLDVCFVGFLIIAMMYDEMGKHLQQMLTEMESLEVENSGGGKQLTKYQRMQRLCDCADSIDECNAIYAELYALTKHFHCIFQWQVLYYIYYNFMVTLLLLHQFIWMLINQGWLDFVVLFMVVVKIVNMALLILCTNYAVDKSQMPSLLCLDVICSGIDDRWDTSVETFVCQRKVENLKISVLGFFQLNNEFILVILSGIVSYLFILIQFGLNSA